MNRNGTSKKPEMFSKVLKWNLKQTGKWKETGKELKEELNFEPVFSKKNQSISSPMLSASQVLNLSSNMTLGYLKLLTTYES